jgi:flagellar M-ring protein FliF
MEDENLTPPSARFDRRQIQLMAIVFALVMAGLLGWYWFVLRQDYAVLYRDLRPAQAAAIVATLEASGADYWISGGGSEIQAPVQVIDALRVELAGAGAPMAGAEGFELFNESDMGLTDFAQKIRYQRAIQGELARTIMMMQGVADARVHVSIPERTLFRGERRNAEAAVTLIMRVGEDATPERIDGIQRLVAASIQDLAASDVVVLNARGEVISSSVTRGGSYSGSARTGDDPSLDFIAEAIRLAIPHRRFDVRVEDMPPSLDGASEGDAAAETPRRLITVASEMSLSTEERGRLRTTLESAGVIDGSSRQRSEERRVGKECRRLCRSRWSPYH